MDNLLKLYPEYTSILGPYSRSDGRQHIVLNNSNASKGTKGKTKTISYPKAIIENYLNRRLENDETVHHKDGNPLNNEVSNLEILPRSTHIKQDVRRAEYGNYKCDWCGTEFTLTKNQVSHPKKPHFCCKSCAGKYGNAVQWGKIDPITDVKIPPTKYFKNSSV